MYRLLPAFFCTDDVRNRRRDAALMRLPLMKNVGVDLTCSAEVVSALMLDALASFASKSVTPAMSRAAFLTPIGGRSLVREDPGLERVGLVGASSPWPSASQRRLRTPGAIPGDAAAALPLERASFTHLTRPALLRT
jgi:hypothetical protein